MAIHRLARRRRGRKLGRSLLYSEEIDDGEERHPNDVERVPEQAEAKEATQDVGAESFGEDLRHHCQEPEQAGRNVKTMTSDDGEEGREEGASGRTRSLRDKGRELPCFKHEEIAT